MPTAEALGKNYRYDGGKDRCYVCACVQSLCGVGTFLAVYGKYADYGSQYSDCGDDERENGALYGVVACGYEACAKSQCNCGDYGSYVGFEQVGTHAGDVAYVVAYVICYNCRVSGVVLGDAGFYLTYKVRAYVGSLGVDAAAYTAEQSHGGSAQTESGEALSCGLGVQKQERKSYTQDAQAYYAKTHNCAAPESDLKSLVHSAVLGGGCCSYVALCGYLHSEVSGKNGERCAEYVQNRGHPAESESQDDGKNYDYYYHCAVFPAQECHCALVNESGDLGHAGVARRLLTDPSGKYERYY